MRYFDIRDFQWTALILILAAIALIVFFLAMQGYPAATRRRQVEKEEEYKILHKFPGGISEDNNPVPAFLVFLYLAIIVWVVIYVFFIGYRGQPF